MIINQKLRVKVIRIENGCVEFKITNQPNNWRHDGADGSTIFQPTGMTDRYCRIRSYNMPEARENNNTLYIWGNVASCDNRKISCRESFFNKIKNTLRDIINEKNKLY